MTLPLTILGGYLGAGKTTLVNAMLRDPGGRRLAVLVNDFGDLAIDADLIEAEGDDLIALAGGCVCCSYGDDLMAALMRLTKLDQQPDAVILEASGVAMPDAVGAAVGLMPGMDLSGVVVLADATRLTQLLTDRYLSDTVERQLQASDLIVVTKTDIGDANAVEDAIAQVVPDCPMVRSDDVSTALVLAKQACRLRPEPITRGHGARHLTRLLSVEAVNDLDTIAAGLAADAQVVRAKGCARTTQGFKLLQLVGENYTISPAPVDASEGIVVISVPEP